MSDTIDAGRKAIEAYFIANWTATPYGLDGFTTGEIAAPFVRMTIGLGRVRQGSIGRVVNVLHNTGVVMFQIMTDGGKGTAQANDYAEAMMELFRAKMLDSTGALVTSQAQQVLVRFSPPELGQDAHPYVASREPDAPFLITNVNAPFVRYSER